MALEGAQAEGEAGDVAEPVNGRSDRPGSVLELDEKLADHVDRVEPLREVVAPAAATAEPVPEPQGRKREHAPGGDGNRPRHRQAGPGLVDVVEEEQNRDDARRWSKERVLQRSQTEHPHACLAIVHELLPECVQVDGEAAASDEDAETRCNERERAGVGKVRSVFDSGHLAVGQHIADVGEHLGGERERQPVRVDVTEAVGDSAEPRGPSDTDYRRSRKRGSERDEGNELVRPSGQMGAAAEGARNLHRPDIGTRAAMQTPQSGHVGRFGAGAVRADRFGQDRRR